MIINILLWIIFGGIVGWVASMLMGTDAQQGLFLNVVVGIAGAIIGGILARLLGLGAVTGFNLISFIVALIGAVALLGIVKLFDRA